MAAFSREGRRVDDDVRTEISPRRLGGERAGAELGEGVSPAVRQFDVVTGLAAAAVADDQVGLQLSRQVIHGRAFPLVAETEADRDDGTFHGASNWSDRSPSERRGLSP